MTPNVSIRGTSCVLVAAACAMVVACGTDGLGGTTIPGTEGVVGGSRAEGIGGAQPGRGGTMVATGGTRTGSASGETNRAGGDDAPSGRGGNGGAGGSGSGAGAGAGVGVDGTGGAKVGAGGSANPGGKGGAGGAGADGGKAGTASGSGGARSGTGGTGTGGARAGAGGKNSAAGGSTESPSPSGACSVGPWAEANPAATGPFPTVTENNVGPTAGVGADGGAAPAFTLFRPADMAQGGLCHPIVTWGNGTGATPSMYRTLLNHLASHGFVVIASNSPQVAQGTPPPMLAGVTWVLEQNEDPASPMHQRIDPSHVGATGHSQGGFATTSAAGDARITTIAPLCGASAQRNLHGPALLLCGGQDTTVPCSSVQSAYNSISTQPVMLASYLAADHANWLTFRGTQVSPMEAIVTAWMRVHLMDDTALRGRFYGADCTLCQDTAWQVSQKKMDP